MGRMTDLFARPSAWLGLVGLVLLATALVWTGYADLMPAPAAACPDTRPSGPADHIRILDVGSAELALRGSVCLVVDNVVSAATIRGRSDVAKAAHLDLAQADQAVATLAAPAPPPPPARGTHWWNRPAPVVISGEQRNAARIRRDAAAARARDADAAVAELTANRKLVLFLNGERSPAEPRLVRGVPDPQTVTFALHADPRAAGKDAAYWRDLLGQHSDRGIVPVVLGIAEEAQPMPAATIRATPARNGGTSRLLGFRVYHPPIVWLAGLGLPLTLIGLVGVARTTNLLRDGRTRMSSYSLARIQMAWWFALTIAGFVYICLISGQYLGVVGSATFVLLGIAGATAGAARVVDGPKAAQDQPSLGFFADISGGTKVELHRLQMIAWTVVLGGIYAYNVLLNFTLTDFDANLLALAGIVNGVYVGLKTQET